MLLILSEASSHCPWHQLSSTNRISRTCLFFPLHLVTRYERSWVQWSKVLKYLKNVFSSRIYSNYSSVVKGPANEFECTTHVFSESLKWKGMLIVVRFVEVINIKGNCNGRDTASTLTRAFCPCKRGAQALFLGKPLKATLAPYCCSDVTCFVYE